MIFNIQIQKRILDKEHAGCQSAILKADIISKFDKLWNCFNFFIKYNMYIHYIQSNKFKEKNDIEKKKRSMARR